jgi:hypothetical protein
LSDLVIEAHERILDNIFSQKFVMCDEKRYSHSPGLIARNENLQTADITILEAPDGLQIIHTERLLLTL